MNLPSLRKNFVVTPPKVTSVSLKSPSTLASVACSIAWAWCDELHALTSAGWHAPQDSRPMNSLVPAIGEGASGGFAPVVAASRVGATDPGIVIEPKAAANAIKAAQRPAASQKERRLREICPADSRRWAFTCSALGRSAPDVGDLERRRVNASSLGLRLSCTKSRTFEASFTAYPTTRANRDSRLQTGVRCEQLWSSSTTKPGARSVHSEP